MLSLETLLLVGGAVYLLYLYLTWNDKYWTQRGIASAKPTLLFGNIGESMMMTKTIGEMFTELYTNHPGEKVVGWFKFRTPALMIRDPQLIHKVLVTDFNSFRNNDIELDPEVDPILGRNIFVLRDELWKKSRALITPAFTTNKVKAVFPQMVAVSQDLAAYLKKHPEDLHIKHTMSRYTAEIVAKCALGIEGNCFKDEKPTIHEMGKLVFEPDMKKGMKMMLFFMLPPVVKLLKLKFVPDEVINFFDSVLKDVIVYRQKNNIERNDLMQYLIDVKRKTIEVEKGTIQSDIVTRTYTDQDVLAGCVMFFVEAYETSAVIMTNILYLLAMNPDKQAKLRQEVDQVFNKGELTFEALSDMAYLNSVLSETNRVLPAGFHVQKLCTERYEMDVGKAQPLVVEKGTSIVVPLYALHNDNSYWEHADQFRPERFSGKEDLTAKAKGVFLPFGDGPRMCIGVRISSTLIKVALAHIIRDFEVVKTSRTPDKIQPDPNYFMLAHKGGMFLRFEPRTR